MSKRSNSIDTRHVRANAKLAVNHYKQRMPRPVTLPQAIATATGDSLLMSTALVGVSSVLNTYGYKTAGAFVLKACPPVAIAYGAYRFYKYILS